MVRFFTNSRALIQKLKSLFLYQVRIFLYIHPKSRKNAVYIEFQNRKIWLVSIFEARFHQDTIEMPCHLRHI